MLFYNYLQDLISYIITKPEENTKVTDNHM